MDIMELDNSQTQQNQSKKQKRTQDDKYRMKKNIEIGGQFTLIKNIISSKATKVERVLPDWLSNPIPIKKSLKKDLKSPKEVCCILQPDLLTCLHQNKITKFFPVQEVVIPYILNGAHGVEYRFPPRDICVATPTGSGKTLAFVIPIVQALGKRSFHSLSAVVILPVIELAKQIYKVFSTYAPLFGLAVGKAFSGENFQMEQEQMVQKVYDTFYSKVDILVATPGRLFDHITKTPGMDFTQLRFLVLDEADKLLTGENGQLVDRILGYVMQFKHQTVNLGLPPFFPLKKRDKPDIFSYPSGNDSNSTLLHAKKKKISLFSRPFEQKLINLQEETEEYFHIPCPPVQRLLFSATLTHDPEQLQNVTLFRPILFTTDADEATAEARVEEVMKPLELTEEWVKTDLNLKPLVLHYILRKERMKKENFKCLVFAGSVELTSKLTVLLKALSKDKYVIEEFSSKFHKERKTRISYFLQGKINVLVASDAMARGVDVPDIDCVISYDVPSSTTYTHRVGRTARAGKPGKAVSIVTEDELKNFKRALGKNFADVSELLVDNEKLKKFESAFRGALGTLAEALRSANQTGKIKKTLNRKRKFIKNLKRTKV